MRVARSVCLLALLVTLFAGTVGAEVSLHDFFQLKSSPACPVAAWHIEYNSCRDTSCPVERYDVREETRKVDGKAQCGGFHTPAACQPRAQAGELIDKDRYSSKCKDWFAGLEIRSQTKHYCTFYKNRHALCAAAACGELSRTPSAHEQCRDYSHGLDLASVNANANGTTVSRALALMAISLTDFQGLPHSVRSHLFNKMTGLAETDAAKVEAVRRALMFRGDLLTADEIDATIEQQDNLAIAVTAKDDKAIRTLFSSKFWEPIGYTIGHGVNTVSGEAKGACVANQKPVSGSNSKETRFFLERYDDYRSLVTSLFARASLSVMGGIGSANASASFSHKTSVSEHSIFLVARVETILEDTVYTYDLADEWKGIQNSGVKGRQRFYEGCGDAYVKGLRRGGEFMALYELTARDESEKERLKASFSGNSAAGSFSASGELTKALERAHKFTHIQVSILNPGYVGGKLPDTPEEILAYVKEFPEKVNKDNATILSALLDPYSNLAGYETGNPFHDLGQLNFLKQADSDFQLLLAKQAIVNYVKANPELFDWSGQTRAEFTNRILELEKRIQTQIELLTAVAGSCFSDNTKCKRDPLNLSSIEHPKMLQKIMLEGGCSGAIARFGVFNGGCHDASTNLVWSAPTTLRYTFAQASRYCDDLTQNQTRGWTLPSIYEAATLAEDNAGSKGLSNGKLLNDLYWVHDGESPKSGYRINLETGLNKKAELPDLPLRVICRQTGYGGL